MPRASEVVECFFAFASPSNSNRNLRNVLGHEHGHGLGMAHTCSSDALILMAPAVGSSFDGPRQDDIRGIQRHYGDPFEPNEAVMSPSSDAPPTAPSTVSSSMLTCETAMG